LRSKYQENAAAISASASGRTKTLYSVTEN
jgi:hypothetical protein